MISTSINFFRPGADAVEGGVDSNEENFNLMIKCLLGQKRMH